MPFSLKTFKDFYNLTVGKFQKELPEIDPTIESSLARAVTGSAAVAGVGLQEGIQDAVNQMFWQTADDDFLEIIGEYDKTTRFEAQIAGGLGVVEGTLGTLIPLDTPLTKNGKSYKVTQDAYIQVFTGAISLSYSAGIVEAETDAVHSLATGLTVVITGATQTEYNGTFVITVLDENTFSYEITGTPSTTDNGTYTAEYALLDIESIDAGSDVNIDAGGTLKIDVVNVDDDVFVGVDGITGGLEEEDIEEYRERIGENHSLTTGLTTESMIKYSAKKVAGNTRVYVERPIVASGGYVVTNGTRGSAGYLPNLAETVIYILRDNDVSIVPNSAKLAETKQQIIDDGLWSTLTADDNLFVLAPTVTAVNFSFSSITPNTATMQNAIRDQLVSFFEDYSDINRDITLDEIRTFLKQIQDSSGAFLTDFTMTTPAADLDADYGELFQRGTVSFT